MAMTKRVSIEPFEQTFLTAMENLIRVDEEQPLNDEALGRVERVYLTVEMVEALKKLYTIE